MHVVADELAARANALVGLTLSGKWRLDALLGIGGCAAVYRSKHVVGDQHAAIKLLHPEYNLNLGMRKRFLNEGYAANRVQHPGVVKVLDDGVTADGLVYLVMELLRGENMQTRMSRKGGLLPPAEVMSISYSVLGILDVAHSKGIIHRDIKPENVFLTHGREIKLLDFGLARVREPLDDPPRQPHEDPPTLTRAGTLLGSPSFMAPEQALGRSEDVDARTDVWAVGAMMYTLLTGRTVHEGRTPHESLVMAAARHADSLASVAPAMPTPVVAVVDRALHFAKDGRWLSAKVMQQAVSAAYDAMRKP
jgi:serine/threonine protein kinase